MASQQVLLRFRSKANSKHALTSLSKALWVSTASSLATRMCSSWKPMQVLQASNHMHTCKHHRSMRPSSLRPQRHGDALVILGLDTLEQGVRRLVVGRVLQQAKLSTRKQHSIHAAEGRVGSPRRCLNEATPHLSRMVAIVLWLALYGMIATLRPVDSGRR